MVELVMFLVTAAGLMVGMYEVVATGGGAVGAEEEVQ
jgi:hypothetical protein